MIILFTLSVLDNCCEVVLKEIFLLFDTSTLGFEKRIGRLTQHDLEWFEKLGRNPD